MEELTICINLHRRKGNRMESLNRQQIAVISVFCRKGFIFMAILMDRSSSSFYKQLSDENHFHLNEKKTTS